MRIRFFISIRESFDSNSFAGHVTSLREVLEAVWENPGKSEEILAKVAEKNKDAYEFEKRLMLKTASFKKSVRLGIQSS